MKSLLITIALLLSAPAIAQARWEDQIARNFYTRIDTAKKLVCCDYVLSDNKVETITVVYRIPVDIFTRDSFNTRQHSESLLDSVDVWLVSNRLIAKYNKRFSKRRARKFKKSCYSTQIASSVHEDLVDDLVFIQSTIYFVFTFQ
jgi:hypothetical protein